MPRLLPLLVVMVGPLAFAQPMASPGRVFTPDMAPKGSDVERFEWCVRQALKADGGTVYLPYKGKSYEWDRPPAAIRPVSGAQARVNIVGDPVWTLIKYTGRPNVSLIKAYGLKQSRFEDVSIVSHADGVVGFDLAGDKGTPSSTRVWVLRCRFQAWEGTRENIGVRIGQCDGDWKALNIDQSYHVVDQFNFVSRTTGPEASKRQGHDGIWILGMNTLAITVRDAWIDGAAVALRLHRDLKGGVWSGGNGTSFRDCGGSGNALCYWIDEGHSSVIDGGRWELGGAFLQVGHEEWAGRNGGAVTVRNVLLADLSPKRAGYPLIGLNASGRYRFESVTVTRGRLGEAPMPEWLSLNAATNATLDVVACQGLEWTRPMLRNGDWSARVEHKPVAIAN